MPFVLIAGPCAIENLDSALFHAEKIKNICFDLKIPLIYKSSFDKANRTSISSERGIGIDDGRWNWKLEIWLVFVHLKSLLMSCYKH